jgi:multicomponent Na+:H+ antiporter subunit D
MTLTLLNTPSTLLFIAFMLPIFTASCVAATGAWKNLRDGLTLTLAALTFLVVMRILGFFLHDTTPITYHLMTVANGLDIAFKLEGLGMIFALVASFLWGVTSLYAFGYMRGNKEKNQTRFFIFFALAISFALGIAFSANLFTMFLFYELLSLSTYPLVTHHQTQESLRAGRVYLGILMGTSIGLFLPAIIWTYSLTGTTDFTSGGILAGHANPFVIGILLFLFMYGIGKAALMPIHRWLPAAMVAPTPVSALLHAVAVVKAGVFCVVKIIVYIFGADLLKQMNLWEGGWLLYASGITILLASVVAMKQESIKKLLAYSTISQLSYVIMAAALFSPLSTIAAAFHIAAHAIGKITLFFAAGAIYTASKKKNISELAGIGKMMPLTMTAFTIGALSMIGLPPTAGFFTKWYMLGGVFDSRAWFALAVIVLSTVLNAFYFLPIIYNAFLAEPAQTKKPHGEAPLPILIALSITALGVIALFLWPDVVLRLAEAVK